MPGALSDGVLTFVASYWGWVVSGDESDRSLQSHQSARAGRIIDQSDRIFAQSRGSRNHAKDSDKRLPIEKGRISSVWRTRMFSC